MPETQKVYMAISSLPLEKSNMAGVKSLRSVPAAFYNVWRKSLNEETPLSWYRCARLVNKDQDFSGYVCVEKKRGEGILLIFVLLFS